MAFMYDYLTGSELEIEKKFRRNEADSLRLINAMEAVVMRHELDLSQIEAKAVFENYTEDILASEYEREYNIYTEGVKEAWEKFKQWLKSIIDAILGRNKQNNNADVLQSVEEVELEYEPNSFVKFIDSVVSAIKQFFTFKKVNADGNSEVDKAKVTIAGIGTVAGVGGIIAAFTKFKDNKNKTKTKVKDLPKISDKISSALSRLKNVVSGGSSDNADGSIKSKVMTVVSEIVNFGKKFVDKIGTIITKFTKGGKSAPELPGENTPETGDGNGSNGGTNEEPPTSQEGKPEKDQGPKQPASDGGNQGANPSNGNDNKKMYSYGGAQVPSEIVSYAFSHGKVGINDANKNRNKKKISLSSKEMAAVYNAAKQNGDLNEKDLEKWKAFINKNGDKAVTVEFTDDGCVTMGDPIFENMGLGDIDRILGDDYDIDEMFESTDTGLLDDINGIFDEFFS